ncbi:MAG: lipid-A-disaccharide synthase [Gallionellales bacterium RIFCSPLOWO2_12_FULL_59_22]|nr:MAG: lipid-A-disaccharide synthase [Gallionellales bacterium RIFCSPLOWO2_02_FULL_59_110]OGT05184.1 MAG: lipid-A-disaccharide synthase [Gallionellales bacterium RIFCSPLOWO2_02_58_13]OGT10772.1 MAG: lipid-A-disaccharide synthase [Gallionellales bacterium RIFCSPLOWO2_12_FULL_59_22]
MQQKKIVIGIVAGEASGDLLGSHLMAALREARPGIEFVGIGGPKMQAVGMNVLFPMEKLAVRGYVEVLLHYREITGIRRKLKNYFLSNRPDLFIAVDAPDFNLDLELALKASGIPTIHYVSPSIWAWRGERINKIKRAVSHMLALFPHEPELYRQAGVPVDYVGHPLADMLPEFPKRAEMRETMRIPPQARVFAFLPGSRQSEVKYLAHTYIETAKLILQQEPDARFLVPLISRETRAIFDQALYDCEARDMPITLLFGHAQDAMIAADIALVASGTATLECALLKRPMVITYKMPTLSWWMIKRKRYQPYCGLPNILCERFVVPELIQEDATPEKLAKALLDLVNDKNAVMQLEETFRALHRTLRQNTAQKAAAAILPYLPTA